MGIQQVPSMGQPNQQLMSLQPSEHDDLHDEMLFVLLEPNSSI
jgi:hypothetical protein